MLLAISPKTGILCASLREVLLNDSSKYLIADKSFLAKSLCAFISSRVLEISEISDFAFSSSANRSLSVVETIVLMCRFIILKTKAALKFLTWSDARLKRRSFLLPT